MKKIAIIPTLLTLGNAVCGFVAIIYASKIDRTPETAQHFTTAAWFIFGGMVFDALDGYVARLSRTASEFGGQLDSLCDAITFGITPAFLLLKIGQDWAFPGYRQAIGVVAALYMCCAILRLARFNTKNSVDVSSHKRFQGLPSPAAAGCIAALAFFRNHTPISPLNESQFAAVMQVWAILGSFVVSVLMVSRFSFPHLTNQLLRGRRRFSHVVQVVIVAGLMFLTYEIAFFVLFWGYALAMPIRAILVKALKPIDGTESRTEDAPELQ